MKILTLIIVLLGLFTSNVFAQGLNLVKAEQPTKTCSGEKFITPQTISIDNNAFADYLRVASLPREQRQLAFSELSNEQKAVFVKIQFALQFVKRPNMTKPQKDFILESVLRVSPDLYDKGNPQKVAQANQLSQEAENIAFNLFPRKDALEILEGLGASKSEDVTLLQKYEDLLKAGMLLRRRLVKETPLFERVNIWRTQLAYHLATSSLSREQKAFTTEIMSNIPSIIEASSNLMGEEKDRYLADLEANMFRVFTKPEAYSIFMTIGIQNKVPDKPEILRQFDVGYTN